MSVKINIKILVAPLDWGLGHATRSIPIITQLLKLGCKVIIAAEGAQEKLLKTEFPEVAFVHLPGYRITYSQDKRFFSLKIIAQLPKILRAIKRENSWLKRFVSQQKIDAIISDNRYGLYCPGIPSVFITHQLLIKAPFSFAEMLMQKANYSLIKKFTTCWVPDEKGPVNMAGRLSHPTNLPDVPVNYLGGLSRLDQCNHTPKRYDVAVIISGPEPQRSLLETKVLTELAAYKGKALLVRGLPGSDETVAGYENLEIKNHLPSKQLEEVLCNSEMIISRSGYTTVMDICKLGKKAVLIPTPGQTEQEYLAKHLQQQGWCIMMEQKDFSLPALLKQVENFEYKLPHLDMDAYKTVVDSFVAGLTTTS